MVGEAADGSSGASDTARLKPDLSPERLRAPLASAMSGRLLAVALGAMVLTALSAWGFLHDPSDDFSVYRLGHTPLEILREITVAWAFIASGLIAWHRRRPRIGLLMVAVGAALLMEGLRFLPIPVLVSIGLWFSVGAGLSTVLLGVLVLTYPRGRLGSQLERIWIALAGGYALLLLWISLITPMVPGTCYPCRPALILAYNERLRSDVVNIADLYLSALAGLLLFVLVRRWVMSSPPARRSLTGVWFAGAVIVLIAATGEGFWNLWSEGGYFRSDIPSLGAFVWRRLDPQVWAYLPWVQSLLLLLVPFSLLWGLFRLRLRQSAVSALAVELGRTGPHRPLVEALRRALGDPSLEIAFWSRPARAYVTDAGAPMTLPVEGGTRSVTRLEAADGPLAALIHDPALAEQRPLVDGVAAVARLSIENERLHAEVKAQLEEVRASRERIVRAADHERRRVERNIHDGAQQRLVSLSLAVSMARAKAAEASPEVALTLAEAEAELRAAIADLRELARGIHPAILTEAGLGPALESLVEHSAVPVRLHTELSGRLASSVEAAAYFVVAEALTNVAKYAAATSVELSASVVDGWLRLVVADDGVGGADPEKGSGLRGLLDRVAALGGRLSVEDVPGGGTRVTAEMPCG